MSSGKFEIPIVVTDTIDDEGILVAVSSDDAEQQNDEIDALFDDDLDAGWEGAPEDQNILITGLRFRDVFIPEAAIIDSAFIQIWSHEGKSAEDIARITIVGENSDNAQTYTEDALITARPETTNKVLWEVAEEWELWEQYQSPDISAIVKEIINRPGWVPGNALAFALKGENQGLSDFENAREFESFENIADPEDGGDGQNHPERRPRLVIYFSSMTTSILDFNTTPSRPLTVYPNPVNTGELNIELAGDQQALIDIFDTQGQSIRSAMTFGQNVRFQVGSIPSGIYVIRAIQQGQAYVTKLVIEN